MFLTEAGKESPYLAAMQANRLDGGRPDRKERPLCAEARAYGTSGSDRPRITNQAKRLASGWIGVESIDGTTARTPRRWVFNCE